jgi:hypothetical protein
LGLRGLVYIVKQFVPPACAQIEPDFPRINGVPPNPDRMGKATNRNACLHSTF